MIIDKATTVITIIKTFSNILSYLFVKPKIYLATLSALSSKDLAFFVVGNVDANSTALALISQSNLINLNLCS